MQQTASKTEEHVKENVAQCQIPKTLRIVTPTLSTKGQGQRSKMDACDLQAALY